jgi:hypothetical protein
MPSKDWALQIDNEAMACAALVAQYGEQYTRLKSDDQTRVAHRIIAMAVNGKIGSLRLLTPRECANAVELLETVANGNIQAVALGARPLTQIMQFVPVLDKPVVRQGK